MDATPLNNEQHASRNVTAGIVRRVIQVILVTAIQAAILFLAAGRLDLPWAWIWIGLYLAGMVVNGYLMLRHSPETIAERSRASGMKGWDKVVGGSFGVLYFIGIPLVAGLDLRFDWSGEVALIVHVASAVAFLLAFAFLIWSMVSNAYFATVVRIQNERGQAVCDTGPYQYVRHPGYVGALIHSLTVPLIIGSWWALIPGGLAVGFMVGPHGAGGPDASGGTRRVQGLCTAGTLPFAAGHLVAPDWYV
jgi:protein-S-isoprenylcysteine O-methyltransferase Ste14